MTPQRTGYRRPMTADRRRWQDLTPGQRGAIALLGAVQLGLQAVALRDLRRRPAAQVHGSKRAWALASFVNFLGPISYLRWGREA